ncbi:MAG: hypothetical protein GDYSWBUE_001715 [Candidatus Fervidibacterota bacterium]
MSFACRDLGSANAKEQVGDKVRNLNLMNTVGSKGLNPTVGQKP